MIIVVLFVSLMVVVGGLSGIMIVHGMIEEP